MSASARRTGYTSKMLAKCVVDVLNGKAVLVVAHTGHYAEDLKAQFMRAFAAYLVMLTVNGNRVSVMESGGEARFIGLERASLRGVYRTRPNVYVDNSIYCLPVYPATRMFEIWTELPQ